MIWNEELAASLDQGSGVVVFHHAELSRTQQLATTLAERLGALVEASEKSLDAKQGGAAGTGWGERADGAKGERREQTQERSGRSERSRGGASTRGMLNNLQTTKNFCLTFLKEHGEDAVRGFQRD